ncbi:MAG TPA: hypothetical protein VEC13_03365, partial [Candidatus Paceibacterota bacterium]|nr:hypothetical protein [Candidatus Paceibacterota bacterium]
MKTKVENKIIFYGLCVLFLILPLVIFFENQTNLFNIEPAAIPQIEASSKNGGSDNKSYQSQATLKGEPQAVDKSKSFSIVVLPDTQKYVRFYPDILCNQTEWI